MLESVKTMEHSLLCGQNIGNIASFKEVLYYLSTTILLKL